MEIFRTLVSRIGMGLLVCVLVFLPVMLLAYWERKNFTEKLDEKNYILRQPNFVIGVGLTGTVVFFAAFLFLLFFAYLWVALLVIPFVLLCLFVFIRTIRWKIVVNHEELIVRQLFKRLLQIEMSQIDYVKENFTGITAYCKEEKLFTVDTNVFGFQVLYAKLYKMGKMQSTQQIKAFSLRVNPSEMIGAVLACVLSSALLTWTVLCPRMIVNRVFYLITVGLFLFSLYALIAQIRWRIEVNGDYLMTQKPLERGKYSRFSQINKVIIKKDSTHLIQNNTVLIKVSRDCTGYATLIERLYAENIPFYYKGELINFD